MGGLFGVVTWIVWCGDMDCCAGWIAVVVGLLWWVDCCGGWIAVVVGLFGVV